MIIALHRDPFLSGMHHEKIPDGGDTGGVRVMRVICSAFTWPSAAIMGESEVSKDVLD